MATVATPALITNECKLKVMEAHAPPTNALQARY